LKYGKNINHIIPDCDYKLFKFASPPPGVLAKPRVTDQNFKKIVASNMAGKRV
jgi:hypothetical protein